MIKKAVVVGGSGFIGSHVADKLSDAGFIVTIYDISKSQWIRGNQKFVMGDVLDKEKLNKVISGADVVYNFAALANLDRALEQPIKTINVNILGNLNVMEASFKNGVKNLLVICPGFASDCVETLEEIDIQGRESFLENGGQKFEMIPCLNDSDIHIDLFQHIIKKYIF